ncbi:hypothetical protein RND81_04G129700 [Saponaria officinalis]|uniref:Prolamin-like domain-containing protein n=1 Tax=Saponaria officinalis TaxID=3572 RepID=A0AAW1LLK6_SAPOF
MDSKTMSTINLSFAFVILCITLTNARPVTHNIPAPSPSADALQICGYQISPICGDSIFHYIFGPAVGETILKECCTELIHMGRECHAFLTEVSLKTYDVTNEEVEVILSRNNEVWEVCKAKGQIN